MKTVQVISEESGYCEDTEHYKSSVFITRNDTHGKISMSLQIPKDRKDDANQDLFLYRCSVNGNLIHENLLTLNTLICMFHLIEAQIIVYGIESTQLDLVKTVSEET